MDQAVMNKPFELIDKQIDQMLSEMFDIIKNAGPKVSAAIGDKLIYQTNPAYMTQKDITMNVIISLICYNISDRTEALTIYMLTLINEKMAVLFGQYFTSKSLSLKSQRILPPQKQSIIEMCEKIYPQLTQFRLDGEIKRREHFIETMGYSVPSAEALDRLKVFCGGSTVLEIGAGRGLWASLMIASRIKTIATDIGTTGGYKVNFTSTWTPIELMDHKTAIKTYGAECAVCFMSWPTAVDNTAAECVELFRGPKLVYVGESFGGSTANDAFFEILHKKFILTEAVEIPQWAGMYDRMYFFERKDGGKTSQKIFRNSLWPK
jgi:hypothetical protein